MAPFKQPYSLHRQCLSYVSYLLKKASNSLFLEFGYYDNKDCVQAVNDLQSHVVSTLPFTVFQELATRRNMPYLFEYSSSDNTAADEHSLLNLDGNNVDWLVDSRIKLSLYLHPSLHRFTVEPTGNELLQNHVDGMDEYFWRLHLKRLVNLTHLNLSMIATDSILITVGQYCTKLVNINIVSKILNNDFPLKLCVSDIGLYAIAKLNQLRSITMNKIIPSISSNDSTDKIPNEGITLGGIRHLITSLTHLEHLNFGSMGLVLSGEFSKVLTKLKYFCELRPNYNQIKKLGSLCPNITEIVLSSPISLGLNGSATGIEESQSILKALANEPNLNPKIVELQNFPYGAQFKEFLKNKGFGIQEFLFRSVDPLKYDCVECIGVNCPNVTKLTLRELEGESRNINQRDTNQEMFKNLKSLTINGKLWDPNIILPALLANAHQLYHLCVLNINYRESLDSAILKVLKTNPLKEIVAIGLYSGCYVSMPLLKRLIFDSPKLENLSFLLSSEDNFEMSDVETLKSEVEKLNLNIKLRCLEMLLN